MKLYFHVQYKHRKIYYRTLDSAVLKAFAYLRRQMAERHSVTDLCVMNGSGQACRLMTVAKEICVVFI